MTSRMTAASGWSRVRRAAASTMFAASAGVLFVSACSPTDFLEVVDPDIVNPQDAQSAAGSNAVRLGALARFTTATSGVSGAVSSGGESLLLLGGLFTDEWVNGDTFIARQQIDRRTVTFENNILTTAMRNLHRARLSAEQAVPLLQEFNPTAQAWQVAEMHFVQAYVTNLMAEHFCSGLTFSTVVNGVETFGEQITTQAAFERALGNADAGLALITGTSANDLRMRHALQVTRGRILVNLARYAEAATAVAGVPTGFRYERMHSITTASNTTWLLNNLERRYSVSDAEGVNGLNFATAADPRLPVCRGGTAACTAAGITFSTRNDGTAEPFHVQLLWPIRETPQALLLGVDARLIEAEAQLRGGNAAGALATLNAARATVPGLAPLTDAGTEAGRVDQLFREKAFAQFNRGYRLGDMRRLVRQYNRAPNTVFPTGSWHKDGDYGTDLNLPIPQAEENNPNVAAGQTCLNRDA